jgi:hypothetical protein
MLNVTSERALSRRDSVGATAATTAAGADVAAGAAVDDADRVGATVDAAEETAAVAAADSAEVRAACLAPSSDCVCSWKMNKTNQDTDMGTMRHTLTRSKRENRRIYIDNYCLPTTRSIAYQLALQRGQL